MQHPAIYFEVTVDPERAIKGTNFVRLGPWAGDKKGQGDELCGWINLEEWELKHTLGTVDDHGNVITFKG